MTIPSERTRAVQDVEVFLYKLTDPKCTPKVPRAIRLEAAWLLKHYPGIYHLAEAARFLPEIWGAPTTRSAWTRWIAYRAQIGRNR